MMKENNDFKCEFANEIVSYIYDEMGRTKRSGFADHLLKCASCNDELAGLSFIQTSILEWRDEDFANLAPIIIPRNFTPEKHESPAEHQPWFASLGNLFHFSSAWKPAFVSFAVLTICFGIYFLFSSNPKSIGSNLTASNISKDKVVPSSNNFEKQTPPMGSEIVTPSMDDRTASSIQTKPATPKVSKNQATLTNLVQPKRGRIAPARISVQSIQMNKYPDKTTKQKSLKLVEDDAEDTTLRLSDMINEIAMR